ncbi:MAG TPA: helix-turn-helix domain-containing protein [Nitrososphaeraceae archaeon]|nr:helix-turn-helix domain-containing protein [Nitrososphaeraceae archaeon]
MEIPLNKFEKEKRVIELHLQGKTIRDIAKEVHMSFRDISKIIKAYDKKMRLETKKGEKKTRTKKPSTSSQLFILFKEGKKIDEAKVLLDIPFRLAIRYWKQYLKSIGMFEAFEFYQDHGYDIPTLLSINTFMKRNNISGKDIATVLRAATDVINLNKIQSNLEAEIEKLKQIKNNYSLNQNTNYQPQLLPLGLPKYCYEQY